MRRPKHGLNWGAFGFPTLALHSGVKAGVEGISGLAALFEPAAKHTLFQDSAGTTPTVNAGEPVGLMKDKSGNGRDASQVTNTGYRPTLSRHPFSGIRNLLDESENWDVNNGGAGLTVTNNGALGPDGSLTFDILNSSTDPNDRILKRAASTAQNGNFYTASAVLNVSACTSSNWQMALGKGSEHRVIMEFNPATLPSGVTLKDSSNGTIWKVVSHSYEDLGNGFARISVVGEAVNLSTDLLEVAFWNSDTVAGEKLAVGRTQIERGNTATPYQYRHSVHDIAETGQRDVWYLSDDQIDDNLLVTLPDMGSNATEFWADETGITVNTGQTIGAGNRVLPGSPRLYAYGVVNRALSTTETSQLQAHLRMLSGATV